MNCQPAERIIDLLYHGEDAAAIDSLFEHIKTCDTCTHLLENIRPQPSSRSAEPQPVRRPNSWPLKNFLSQTSPLDDFFVNHPHLNFICELGAGSMGRVYECVDTHSNRMVALKLINREKATPGIISRMEREARIQARFDHPNIVRLLETGSDKGIPYLVMEHVPGGNLREFLKENRFSPMQAAACLCQTARGVAAAHALGVLHRDLKPANILLEGWHRNSKQNPPHTDFPKNFTPKITDFGLAKAFESEGEESSSAIIVGTPAYMSPEQIRGSSGKLTPASDIYALGVIFYETLTGRAPFTGEDHSELFQAIAHREPIAPRELRTGIPRDLETICLKCLEKEPTRRYLSASDLADDLDRFLARQPITARPVSSMQKVARWMKANPLPSVSVLVLAGSIMTLLAGAWLYAHNQNRLKTLAEQDRELARHNEAVAQQRTWQLRDKYFDDMETIRNIYYDIRQHRETGYNPSDLDRLYENIIKIRFNQAFHMITVPELLSQKSEPIVEAFYLAGLRTQERDQDKARPFFEEAVRRAFEIKHARTLSNHGRFCAINSLNYLGLFRYQRNDTLGSLHLFQKGWEDLRIQPDEQPADPQIKRFSLMIGRNYLEQLEILKRTEEAAAVRIEIQQIEAMPELESASR